VSLLAGGNGAPSAEPLPDRLLRIETLLERIEQRLEVQFQRIAVHQPKVNVASNNALPQNVY
jgi:hypothetical protein